MREKFQNQLGEEKSSYLLKHAENPIHWHSWDEEVFRDSKRLDKPIFLSIGYSACHWCHVMERESFSDDEVAEVFNRAFICVKVDCEELVTLDRTYMKFAEALMSSSGGWPLNLFLTPTRLPFYAVTYLPKNSGQGLMGLIELGEHIEQVWKSDEREMLIEHAQSVVDFFRDDSVYKGDTLFDEGDVQRSVGNFFDAADPIFGGMKGDPKFPLSYQLETLMHYGILKEEGRCEYFVRLTLDKMRAGGIYDQVAGGFARYAIDPKWTIPHFEKMLIDNLLLAKTYMEAYKLYGDASYKKTAVEILEFIERALYIEGEGFVSSIDSDRDGVEGIEFTFSYEEICNLLDRDEVKLACDYYGICEEGNFHGRNVLYQNKKGDEIEPVRQKLYAQRVKRKKSPEDRKIITSINGHAVRIFCRAAKIFNEERYFALAKRVLGFIEDKLIQGDFLSRRYCDGEVKYDGVFEDYVALIGAYIEFYEFTGEAVYLDQAKKFCGIVEESFGILNGPYADVTEKLTLFYTRCDLVDRREPSPNSFHTRNLMKMYEHTDDEQYLARAKCVMGTVKAKEGDHFSSMYMLHVAIDFLEKKEVS